MTKAAVCVRMLAEDWDLFEETLTMDAESSAFDRDLREQLSDALGRVKVVNCACKEKTE
jgi:hypothetical protein